MDILSFRRRNRRHCITRASVPPRRPAVIHPAPLNVAEYNQISEWLLQQGWRPSTLLSGEAARALAAPKTAAELADELHVRRVQLDDWLARAAALGQIETVGRSRKYIRKKRPQQGLLKLE